METTQTTHLADSLNIFTYRFQLIQRLQPDFMTDGIAATANTTQFSDW